MVAETVFDSATLELRVPVATPLGSVSPAGCVSVFPLPAAASTTVAPLIGLPPASRTVTVMVALALPAGRVVGEAVRVDCDADTGAESTVTIAVCVSGAPSIVAEIVFVSAAVELRVPVATPLASVGPLGWVSVLPLPVAASTTVAPLIGFPLASCAVTVIVEVPLATTMDAGEPPTVDCAAETDPAATVTPASWVIAVPFAVAATVFGSATVALNAPVGPVGCVRVFPAPVAASTTVAPLIGLPPASRAVTVMVALALPAVRAVGEAVRVDCDADTGAGSTVTVAVSVRGAPSIVAEMVFVSAPVELRVPVATPLASVGPLGWVSVLSLPVTAKTTVAPLIGFPLASCAVTVIVEVPLSRAMNVGAAASVDAEADTDPADTVTIAVCVSAVPSAVADRVFASATVELRIPVAAPLALVVPLGWLRVLPLPVAERITVTPLIGFPPASFTVTVIVELPLPAASDVGEALTVDWEAEIAPAVTASVAVCVTAVPLIVAETVFTSATLELSVPAATPLASVVPLGWVKVLPLPVATSTTVAPLIGFPLASFAVTEIVDVPAPAGSEVGEAVTVDREVETGPGFTVTDAVWVMAVPFALAETVFASATVELSVPVATPLELVGLDGWVSVLPLPVPDSTTVAPLIGFPLASFTVTVIVELPFPAVSEAGAAATVEREADTAAPEPGAPWHAVEPESLKVLPAIGTNFQA